MLAYGDRIAPRVDNDLLISIEDFCPTILSLLGLKGRIPSTVQARDLSEQVKGSREQMPDGQLYMRYSAVDETGTNVDTGTRGIGHSGILMPCVSSAGRLWNVSSLTDRKTLHNWKPCGETTRSGR